MLLPIETGSTPAPPGQWPPQPADKHFLTITTHFRNSNDPVSQLDKPCIVCYTVIMNTSDHIDDQEDPDIALTRMQDDAREAANDLIPILVEKAINGKTKDAVHIFEALADRSGFTKPEKKDQQGPLINLNINAQDMTNMLTGLKTITQEAKSPMQIGPDVQSGEKENA